MEFLKNEGLEWTRNLAEAHAFPSSLAAADFFLQHQFPDAILVIKFDEYGDGFDISIPLLDCAHLFAAMPVSPAAAPRESPLNPPAV